MIKKFEGIESSEKPNIKGLIKDLKEYNNYFNFGAVLARGLIAGYEDESDISEQEEKSQREKFEKLKGEYHEVLDTIGLSMEPVDSGFKLFGASRGITEDEAREKIQAFSEETGITEDDLEDVDSYEFKRAENFIKELHEESNQPIQLKEMRLNVSDANKFVGYLESLKITGITTEDREALSAIAEILTQQFVGQYDVSDPNDDRFFNLIGSLGKITNLYEELGLGESVIKLNELLVATKGRYLKEFLLVEKNHYLSPHGKWFGPATWHTDATVDFYNKKWEEAMDVYNQVRSNSNALDLQTKLKDHLLEAIKLAQNDIEANELNIEDDRNKGFLEALNKAKIELSK